MNMNMNMNNTARRGLPRAVLAAGTIAATLALVVSGCAGPNAEPEPTAATCDMMDTVSFGMLSPSAGYWLPLYAQASGLWAAECIVYDQVAIANTANLLTAVTTNDLQLTAVPTANGFAAIESGMEIVAVASNQNVNDATFVATPEIKSAADLRGKVIGTASLASGATLAMQEILSAAGVKPGEYEIVAGGGSAERQAAMIAGAYDATWLLAPFDLALLADGYSDLGTLGDAFPNDVYSSLFASPSWAAANGDLMKRVLNVWSQASEAFYDAANRDTFEKVLVDAAGATPELATQTYDRYQRLSAISKDGGIEVDQVYSVFAVTKELGTVSEIPDDASSFVDMSYWAEATGNPAPSMKRP